MEEALITLAAFFAGLVDAIVGGGGLILIPTLFSVYPTAAPATLLGTNKCASVCGTAFAAYQYNRRVDLAWSVLLPAAVCAFGGSLVGAWTLTQVNPQLLRKSLPFVLLALLLYTLLKKDLGRTHQPLQSRRMELVVACLIGLLIGWYDGFFGPGTGSFFIFLIVRFLGYDFLHASASAKLLNVSTNIAAIILFAVTGVVWWQIGLMMAVANVAGSFVGSHLALKHGSGFVRWAFVVVVSVLIIKTGLASYGLL